MGCLNDDSNTKRLKGFLNAVTNLSCESFLDLKTAGESLDHTGDLAQTGNGTVRNICHMGLADERHDMMLTC